MRSDLAATQPCFVEDVLVGHGLDLRPKRQALGSGFMEGGETQIPTSPALNALPNWCCTQARDLIERGYDPAFCLRGLPDMVAERARFELANGVRPLRHFQCGLPELPHFEGCRSLNFNST